MDQINQNIPDNINSLTGLKLNGGYLVGEKINRSGTATGGAYSICYQVSKEGKDYFLKAYNLEAYLKDDNSDPDSRLKSLREMLQHHEYECELSDLCKTKKLTRVVSAIDNTVIVDKNNSLIPYIIFERADGDVRRFLEVNQSIEDIWKFKSLHEIAVGIEQLHRIKVYHQDIKPSNILTFDKESKISDLGRAVSENTSCPFLNDKIWGDKMHAAPEILYGLNIQDIIERMLLTDMYLLGSLITFYFTASSFNGLLFSKLDSNLHYKDNVISYEEVKAHLIEAHNEVLVEMNEALYMNDKIKYDLINLIGYLCHPDIKYRKNPGTSDRNPLSVRYGIEKVITKLNLLKNRAEFLFKTSK